MFTYQKELMQIQSIREEERALCVVWPTGFQLSPKQKPPGPIWSPGHLESIKGREPSVFIIPALSNKGSSLKRFLACPRALKYFIQQFAIIRKLLLCARHSAIYS